MAINKYAKVVILAPAIGSALMGIVGLLLLGGVLIAGHSGLKSRMTGQAERNTASAEQMGRGAAAKSSPEMVLRTVPGTVQRAKTEARGAQREVDGQRTKAGEAVRSKALEPQRGISDQRVGETPAARTETGLDSKLFRRPIDGDQLAFLTDIAGRAADNADGKQKVRTLVGLVAPYTPYHFGTDFPLPQVLSTLLLNEPHPIEIRDGRYATISGIRNAVHNRAGLLWVDMREGIALGAIYFDPSNGEPTPTLTIFSRQLDGGSVRMSQLPQAFQEDLSRWAATEGVPPILTRYFIGASGDKYVLKHDENYCERPDGAAWPSPKGACGELNAQAALIDMTASRFLEQTHHASNATVKMIASTGQIE